MLLALQEASDEEAALEADISHIRWAIALVQRRIAGMRTTPPPRRGPSHVDTLGSDTLGFDDTAAAGTERSLAAIDAEMRARGYRCPAAGCRVPEPRPSYVVLSAHYTGRQGNGFSLMLGTSTVCRLRAPRSSRQVALLQHRPASPSRWPACPARISTARSKQLQPLLPSCPGHTHPAQMAESRTHCRIHTRMPGLQLLMTSWWIWTSRVRRTAATVPSGGSQQSGAGSGRRRRQTWLHSHPPLLMLHRLPLQAAPAG